MKNLFTKFVFIALMCSFSHLILAQCPTLDDVIFPSEIVLSVDGLSFDDVFDVMTPEELINTFGYSEAEAYATWDNPDDCENLAYAFEDQAFDLGGGSFKILRTWTVIDWDTGNNLAEIQIIRNIVDLGSYCLSDVTISVSPWACSAGFTTASLLVGGFAYENLTSDPAEGTELEMGSHEVTINGTVAGEDFECITIVNVVDESPPVAVAMQNVIVMLDPTTCTFDLTPDIVDNGSYDSCSDVFLEVSPTTLTQADAGGEVIVTLTVTDEVGNINFVWSTVTVENCGASSNLSCIGITTVAPLNDAGIQLFPEDFLATGSTTNGDLTLTIEDQDGNIIPNDFIPQGSFGSFTYTVTDNDTGNSCWGTLNIPLPYSPCTFLACYNTVNTELSENGEVILSPSDLALDVADCPGLVINISDTDGNLLITSSEPVLTEEGTFLYSVNDTNGNSCWGTLNVGEYVPCPSSLACNAEIFVSMASENGGPTIATITSDMLLEGNTSGCDIDNYTIDLQDTGVVGYQFTGIGSVEVDQASIYTYTITDPVTNNSCWGILYIESLGPCPEVSSVSFPNDIDIALTDLTEDNLYDFVSPENLEGALGFPVSQTVPTWTTFSGCDNLFYTYSDNVSILGDGSYKIIRTWTVLDWLTAEIATDVQIIHNIIFPGLICDFLPNTEPFGDCDSGHSMDDDVEWPADLLNLEDYRIKPAELELFSMVDPINSQPVFVNNEDLYSVDYIDILNELQFNQITVFRVWTVSNGSTVIATYSQTLVIDISNFANLVSVNTMFDRPIPEVAMNANDMTNQLGITFVEENEELNPNRTDEVLNGLTFKDIILLRKHITGDIVLTDLQLMAGDVDQNSSITTLDLAVIQKAILEVDNSFNSNWLFIDATESVEGSLIPRAEYIGIKQGDVDDDAVLGATPQTDTATMLLSDVLINNGESYEATLEYEGQDLSLGVEIHLYYDENLIQVDELYVENDDMNLEYNVDKPGELHLTLAKANLTGFLFSGENLINIKFTANSNGLLSQAIDGTSPRNSYLIDLDSRLVTLTVEIDMEIETGVENTSEHSDLFSVFPNPATDVVNFNFLDKAPSDYTIQFFDASGKLIFQETNESMISVSSLNSGMYFYRMIDGNKAYTGHLSVIK